MQTGKLDIDRVQNENLTDAPEFNYQYFHFFFLNIVDANQTEMNDTRNFDCRVTIFLHCYRNFTCSARAKFIFREH